MPAADATPLFFVTINGRAAPPELLRDVIEIVVDDSLHLPDMFTILLHDGGLRWVDSDLLAVGTEVQITATTADTHIQPGAGALLITGEITALEPNFAQTGEPTLLVRGYDRAHRLHRGKKSRSFLRATDSEIAQKIAQEVKLQAQVDPTSVIHDYVFQDNQTNLEFLQARAQRIGYEVYVKDRTLHFCQRQAEQGAGLESVGRLLGYFRARQRQAEQGATPELVWGLALRDFRPRLTTMDQVDEVIVRGWDPKIKREIVGRATKGQIAPQVGVAESGGELARQAFGISARVVVVNRPVANVKEANAMAQALCDELNGDFIKAEGVCFGNPQVRAGQMVSIQGVGYRFSGQYFVTSATHIYNVDGYETLFNISGRKPDTLINLLDQQDGAGQGWGIAIGLVTNTKDPKGLGRVKVKFPWLADNEESTWARIASPRGFLCLPEINDEVLVAFEHGDIHHPYVLGTLWNGRDKPPGQNVVGRDGKVNQRIIRSRSGHEIILDDSRGKEKIIIRDKTGKNQIVIDSARNAMSIKAKGKLSLEADGEISIKGRNVVVDGGPKVDVKGRTIDLN
jgi:phage protein D